MLIEGKLCWRCNPTGGLTQQRRRACQHRDLHLRHSGGIRTDGDPESPRAALPLSSRPASLSRTNRILPVVFLRDIDAHDRDACAMLAVRAGPSSAAIISHFAATKGALFTINSCLTRGIQLPL